MADYNPFLKRGTRPGPAQAGDDARIEHIEQFRNIPWQTRPAPPSDYENRLGDALEEIFGAGVEDLPTLVRRLNEMGVPDPNGAPWSEASFEREIKRLGA